MNDGLAGPPFRNRTNAVSSPVTKPARNAHDADRDAHLAGVVLAFRNGFGQRGGSALCAVRNDDDDLFRAKSFTGKNGAVENELWQSPEQCSVLPAGRLAFGAVDEQNGPPALRGDGAQLGASRKLGAAAAGQSAGFEQRDQVLAAGCLADESVATDVARKRLRSSIRPHSCEEPRQPFGPDHGQWHVAPGERRAHAMPTFPAGRRRWCPTPG